tara:strand:+ start:46327 stop:46605 length:279 start_codon:yes stop_codon:yes gene_type:complete
MYLEIITPDQILYQGEISSITVPGKSGSFQILKNHAPIVSSLKSGIITVRGKFNENTMHEKFNFISNNIFEFKVLAGTIEMSNNKITLLSEL